MTGITGDGRFGDGVGRFGDGVGCIDVDQAWLIKSTFHIGCVETHVKYILPIYIFYLLYKQLIQPF